MLLDSLVSLRPTVFSEIRDNLAGLHSATKGWIQKWIPDRYTAGRERALKSRVTSGTVQSVDPRGQIPTGVHRAAIETLAYNLYGDLTDSLQMVGRRVNDTLREVGIEESLGGKVAGQSKAQTVRNLTDRLLERGVTGIVDAAGREWKPDTYAEMAARTTLTEAENVGLINQLQDEGLDLVEIIRHGGGASCPICAKYEDRVYSISGFDVRYPPLRGTAFSVAYSTIHPNCKHGLRAYLDRFDDESEETRRKSNAPFVDDRPEREKRAYQESQNRKRKERERRRRSEEEGALDAP